MDLKGKQKDVVMMKLGMILSALMLTVFSSASIASSKTNDHELKVIYGEDSRLDLIDTFNPLHYELAQSTAGMIPISALEQDASTYVITGALLKERGICEGERFDNQITAANCSGFLVAPDLLVTAGHCVRSQRDCDNNAWVFGYGIDSGVAYTSGERTFEVDQQNVYYCEEILEMDLTRETGGDHALIRLSSEVVDRGPLKFRTEGKVEDLTHLVVIGHPTGLPTKVAAGAWVRENRNPTFFVANLDTFGGNSGSAVFDMNTGLVEGILVRGEQDYVFDASRGCRVPKVCDEDGCRGEDVTRITNIEKLMSLAKGEQLEEVEEVEETVALTRRELLRMYLEMLFG